MNYEQNVNIPIRLLNYLISVLCTEIGLYAQTDHPVTGFLGFPRSGSCSAAVVIIPKPLRCGPQAYGWTERLVNFVINPVLTVVSHLYHGTV